jgi:hypothetical protein
MTMIIDPYFFNAFNCLHIRMTCYFGFLSDNIQHWVKPRNRPVGFFLLIIKYDNDY